MSTEVSTSACAVVSYECADGSQHVLKVVGSEGQAAFGCQVSLTYRKLGLASVRVFACPLARARPGAKHWCQCKPSLVGEAAVTVVYVRREIRSMSAADRQDYFDAVKLMAKTPTKQGRKKYSKGFYNYYEMVARHAAFLYTQKCDLGHLGPSFMPTHRAFTNEFSRVIQLIKPHVAMPYWDYLADGDLPDPTKSAVWSVHYYGSVFGDEVDEYIVKDGQFALWRVPRGTEAKKLAALTWGSLGPSRTINPWGYFRGKENNSRVGYLTRIGPSRFTGPLPKTADWLACRDLTVFGEFARCLDYFQRVLALARLRGTDKLNCTALDDFGPGLCAAAYYTLAYGGVLARGLLGVEVCMTCGSKVCALTQTREECDCKCLQEMHLAALRGALSQQQLVPFAPLLCGWTYSVSAVRYPRCDPGKEIRRLFNKEYYGSNATAPFPLFLSPDVAGLGVFGVCSSGVIGDYSDVGTSPLDPIFWVHHTNVDRLLVSWRHAHPNLNFENFGFTFPSNDNAIYPDFLSATNILSPGTPYLSVYPPGDGNPTGVCDGHGLYDPICKGAFSNSFRSVPKDKPMTNFDVLRTINVQLKAPERENYMYDKLQA
eukprot:jgi/Mesen1/6341/ME000328S05626